MTRELTCIICPVGCSIKLEFEGVKVSNITGNNCMRGKAYAETEVLNPQRTLTTTVRCDDGSVLPVKTLNPIPKNKLFEAMDIINKKTVHLPVCLGDVIIEDVFGSKVVAVSNKKVSD